MTQEYKFIGFNMEKISIFYGLFLLIWGIISSFASNSNSLTSYIPSFLGCLIFFFAALAIYIPSKKKLFMHIVVFFGLIAFLGGLDFFRSFIGGTLFQNFWADISKFILLTTGGYFVYQCIRSFIFSRKNNK